MNLYRFPRPDTSSTLTCVNMNVLYKVNVLGKHVAGFLVRKKTLYSIA